MALPGCGCHSCGGVCTCTCVVICVSGYRSENMLSEPSGSDKLHHIRRDNSVCERFLLMSPHLIAFARAIPLKRTTLADVELAKWHFVGMMVACVYFGDGINELCCADEKEFGVCTTHQRLGEMFTLRAHKHGFNWFLTRHKNVTRACDGKRDNTHLEPGFALRVCYLILTYVREYVVGLPSGCCCNIWITPRSVNMWALGMFCLQNIVRVPRGPRPAVIWWKQQQLPRVGALLS